jgi:signal transduction histidine kinase/ActR/RegA family two-component response regulator
MDNINHTVLLIEDDRVDQLAFKRLVKNENLAYNYTIAGSIAEAKKILETARFDIVITDFHLGDGDAFDIFEAIVDTPVIVVTGAGDEVTAVKAMKAGAADYLIKDPEYRYLIALPATVDNAIKRKQLEVELRQRERLLHGIATAMNCLLTTLDYSTAINQALAVVGKAAAADRVYIFENHPHPDTGEQVCSQRFEWAGETAPPQLNNPALQNFSWSAFGLGHWYELLARGNSVGVTRHNFPAGVRPMFEVQDILSLLLVPLLIDGHFWGFIGFDDCHSERHWSKHEEAILIALAASIGGTLKRQQAEEALRQSTLELQAQNAELDAFAHTVAHDLQNPLGPITGFAYLLGEKHGSLSADEIHEFAQRISENGRKMSNIINELLLLAGVRKLEIEAKPLDMAKIVAEALQRLTGMIEEYQAEIMLPAMSVWPVALGYGPWVEEVWANYLSNAMKYGGRPPVVEVGAELLSGTEGLVRFWVRDNGLGFTSEEQAQLFTEFTRLYKVQAKGHGLGLSIVWRIVKKLGGQVGVESQVDRGSTFSFTLPGEMKQE